MAMANDLDALLGRARAHAQAYRRSLATRPVAARASTEQVYERLLAQAELPETGLAPEQVLDELVELAEPGLTAMSGPRFFGWVTGGTLASALAADWMTAVW